MNMTGNYMKYGSSYYINFLILRKVHDELYLLKIMKLYKDIQKRNHSFRVNEFADHHMKNLKKLMPTIEKVDYISVKYITPTKEFFEYLKFLFWKYFYAFFHLYWIKKTILYFADDDDDEIYQMDAQTLEMRRREHFRKKGIKYPFEDEIEESEEFDSEPQVHRKSFQAYIDKNCLQDKLKDSECSICLEKFHETDKIRGLGCSELHIFHVKCIERVKKSKKECPMCRA